MQALYDKEPDEGYWPEIVDREAELWGPLLTHARLAGKEPEARLLQVVEKFAKAKDEIESTDTHIAKAIALYDALKKITADTFSPLDLVEELSQGEAFASTFATAKGTDEKTRERMKATAVGYALRRFRLQPLKRTNQGKVYDVRAAMHIIAAHIPENVTEVTEDTQAKVAPSQYI